MNHIHVNHRCMEIQVHRICKISIFSLPGNIILIGRLTFCLKNLFFSGFGFSLVSARLTDVAVVLWAFLFVSFFIYKILFALLATVLQQHELFLQCSYNWSGFQWRQIADISGFPVHHECSCTPPWREKKISWPLASRVVSHWWTDPDKINRMRSALVKLKIHADISWQFLLAWLPFKRNIETWKVKISLKT